MESRSSVGSSIEEVLLCCRGFGFVPPAERAPALNSSFRGNETCPRSWSLAAVAARETCCHEERHGRALTPARRQFTASPPRCADPSPRRPYRLRPEDSGGGGGGGCSSGEDEQGAMAAGAAGAGGGWGDGAAGRICRGEGHHAELLVRVRGGRPPYLVRLALDGREFRRRRRRRRRRGRRGRRP